ncbi:MAG: carbohydrate kinase [Spirochaeta sp. LUC14_002_19_P3]|nr:MAG: carbohydrate kinase [Spirochaeta sp. LUC14_002_19_P3]
MKKTVLTYGEIMGRLSTVEHGRLIQELPGIIRYNFAGAEANVAASIVLLGGKARFVSALPKNDLGTACIQHLRGIGIDTSCIVRHKGRLGLYYVEAGANQRPSKVIYDREYSAMSLVEHSEFDWPKIFTDASWLHLSGITPAISQQSAINTEEICRLAKEQGLSISCDLNFRKKLWQWQPGTSPKELARKVMPKILQYVDILIANEEDSGDILNIHAENSDIETGQLNQQAYVKVAEQIVRHFPNIRIAATTLRESISASHNNWGAMLFDAKTKKAHFAPLNSQGQYAPYEIRAIVDRVGGGDAFAAGLIYALNEEGSSPERALQFAAAASCLCHSIRGDFNLSSKEDVELLLKGNASGRVQR